MLKRLHNLHTLSGSVAGRPGNRNPKVTNTTNGTSGITLEARPTSRGRNPFRWAGERDWLCLPQDHTIDYPKTAHGAPRRQLQQLTLFMGHHRLAVSCFYEASFRATPPHKWIQFTICNFAFNMVRNLYVVNNPVQCTPLFTLFFSATLFKFSKTLGYFLCSVCMTINIFLSLLSCIVVLYCIQYSRWLCAYLPSYSFGMESGCGVTIWCLWCKHFKENVIH